MKRSGVIQSERKAKKKKPTEESNAEPEVSQPRCYCVVPGDKRFGLLATLIKKNLKKKVVVIFSCHASLAFHSEAFSSLGITSHVIHEKLDDTKLAETVEAFEKADRGLMLATETTVCDSVLPAVDWILWFEPSFNVENHKRLIQQTSSRVLLFLLPQEVDFVKDTGNNLVACEYSDVKTANVEAQMEKIVQKNYRIHQLSMDAYRSYFKACASHSTFSKKIQDVKSTAASFGIKCPPKIHLEN